MQSFQKEYDGRQYMLRPDFELQHLRDAVPQQVQTHRHEYYELLYVLAGSSLSYQVEGLVYPVLPDSIILLNSSIDHHPLIKEHTIYERLLLWLTPEFVHAISPPGLPLWHCFEDPLGKRKNVLYMRQERLPLLKNTLLRFEQNYFSDLYGHEQLTRIYLSELLILLNRIYFDVVDVTEEEFPANKTIEAVLAYILKNLSADLSLDHLAEYFYINKYHLLREFKKYVGYTVHHYIQVQRLKRAEDLILNDKLSLTEVCYRCGFGDYSSFFRLFQRRYGVTPSQFEQRHRD